MKVKIDIFSGFLGAGKTMLIKKLLSEKSFREKIVIIENEFGEVGIDGSILRKSNVEIKEINAGCICCTVSGDFNRAIKEVIEKYKPQRIIIEPSGVAKLSEIIGACKSEDLKALVSINMIVTVVDVLKFEMYITNFSEFYKNQILNAKTIILSRTQKTTGEKLSKVVEQIQSINNKASLITTPWDNLNGSRIIEVAEKDLKQLSLEEINLVKSPLEAVRVKTKVGHGGNEVFNSWGMETPKVFSKDGLNIILDKIKNNKLYGTVLRAKGIIQISDKQWIQFDYVPEEMAIRASTPDYTGRICVIGSGLHKENLKNLFLA